MRIVVVGAGISGLTLAHSLVRQGASSGVEVTVLEGSPRAGGVVRSEHVDGYVCEHGPNGFLDGASETLALVEELGLRPRLLPSSDAARRRFVYRAGRLRPLPTGPGSFLTGDILTLPGRLRIAVEPFVRAGALEDETVHSFVSRRFGREAADVLADAMTTGIFGGGSRELSIRACLPQLWQLEADHGSVVGGLVRRRRTARASSPEAAAQPRSGSAFGRLTSFTGGIEELLAALARSVGSRLMTGTPVVGLQRTPDGWQVHTSAAGSVAADHVVLATGAAEAARLTQSLDASLASELRLIPWAPIAVLCLGYHSSTSGALFDGFGFLVPRGQGLRILGALWDSVIFPGRAPDDHVLVRVLAGGGSDPEALTLDDETLVALARADLARGCGLEGAPRFVRVIRQVPGLPQYRLGHAARLDRIGARLAAQPGLAVIGNSYRGLALNACIAEARALTASLLAPAPPVPRADAGPVPDSGSR